MKTLFYTISLAAAMLTSVTSFAQNKEWTMITYLDGSDLESGSGAGTTDMAEMMAAGTTDNVNVIVLTGGANKDGWRTIKAWHLDDGQQIELNFTPVDNAMSNPANLTSFINWTIQNYPANRYFLNMWNHGMAIRGYGWDENSNGQLTIPSLVSAIGATTYIQGGNYFELIGFDACLMANLEVIMPFSAYGEYFVASQEEEPGHGWNYTPIITALESGSATNGSVLGNTVVDGFIAQANSQSSTAVTLSVTDLTLTANLNTTLEALGTKITQDSLVRKLQQARAQSEEYGSTVGKSWESDDMVDIVDLMNKLKQIEPSVSTEADAVINAVQTAVVYNQHDTHRPHANGISLFLPHNKLGDNSALNDALNSNYAPLSFSANFKSFVKDTYAPIANSDVTPPGGQQVDDLGFRDNETSAGRNDSLSAISVTHASDLEQVRVLLMEEVPGDPDELIVFGSALPDTMVLQPDDSEIYAYYWDGEWLGINGHPAYIGDIHKYSFEDEQGVMQSYTKVKIPAIHHPVDDTTSWEINITYRYDANFNVELESIMRAHYGEIVLVPGKNRTFLQPGDQVQLMYEHFNLVTDVETFIPAADAIMTIVNGNEDLVLEHDELLPGDYEIGYELMDHSHNDTIIMDSRVFTVTGVNTYESFAANHIYLYPNPVDQAVTIDHQNFTGSAYAVQIFDINGRLVFTGDFAEQHIQIPTANLPNGYYKIDLIENNKLFTDKLIIQH